MTSGGVAAEQQRAVPLEREAELAITAIKKGGQLLKYGRRGKPKFCPFKLANDESALIWISGKEERKLKLSHVCRIISGQQTPVFQRYPRPEKESQSFSLICRDRSLDLICKDKAEAEVWITGLRALISCNKLQREKSESKSGRLSFETSSWEASSQRNSSSSFTINSGDSSQKDPHLHASSNSPPNSSSENASSEVILFRAQSRVLSPAEYALSNPLSQSPKRISVDASRLSSSCAASHGSAENGSDAPGDVYIWGEGTNEGILGGEIYRYGGIGLKPDSLLPKPLESAAALDVQMIACGRGHSILLAKNGEVFSWGMEFGGRLGHGIDNDVSCPKLIDGLKGINVELVASGEYHSCAVTKSGDLYVWGDAGYSGGFLENGNEARQWTPKWLTGSFSGLQVSSVSCGPWHTAIVTSAGQLLTFGDGSFGVLGHGDRRSLPMPREVESLKGLRTVNAACGVWHTAAVVEVIAFSSSSISFGSSGKIFTWGDGERFRLGHGDNDCKLVPTCVAALVEDNFSQVACGHSLTLALTTTGQVYTMGSHSYGQLGNPQADGKLPTLIEGKLANNPVEQVACGAHHVAVLTSGNEVYTWGKGANGQLGHCDTNNRDCPSVVESLRDKQVKSIACGTNFTAAICIHNWVSGTDQSTCSGCRFPFNFKRKRHNCYNCGLVFCHSCSSKKSQKASMAPFPGRPYRVCDKCFYKLGEAIELDHSSQTIISRIGSKKQGQSEVEMNENFALSHQVQLQRYSYADSHNSTDAGLFEASKGSFSDQVSPSGKDRAKKTSFNKSRSGKQLSSASAPVPRFDSRTTSPKSQHSSPHQAITTAQDLLSHTLPQNMVNNVEMLTDGLKEEVTKLRAQIEELTQRTRLQQLELERTTAQLKEAIAVAEEERAKCKAAKDALKSLAFQWKNMVQLQGLPVQATSCGNTPTNRLHIVDSSKRPSSSTPCHVQESRVSDASIISNTSIAASDPSSSQSEAHCETNARANKTTVPPNRGDEWVEQYEPGVYVTLAYLPAGAKDLKRVRFSRSWFTEKEAERWWATNKNRVYQHYHVSAGQKYGDELEGKG